MTSWLDLDKAHGLPTPQMTYDTPIRPSAVSHPISGSALLATSRFVRDESEPIAAPSSSFDRTPTQGRFTNAPDGDLIESTVGTSYRLDMRLESFLEKKLKSTLNTDVTKGEGYKLGSKRCSIQVKTKDTTTEEHELDISRLEVEAQAKDAEIRCLVWQLQSVSERLCWANIVTQTSPTSSLGTIKQRWTWLLTFLAIFPRL